VLLEIATETGDDIRSQNHVASGSALVV
jgi:hypothetical protein